jgi:hypothetical protein
MGLKLAIDAWYDNQNYLSQALIQFVTSILVLFGITGLGGLVFCGFESDQARARHAKAQPGRARSRPGLAQRGARVCGEPCSVRSCRPLGRSMRSWGSLGAKSGAVLPLPASGVTAAPLQAPFRSAALATAFARAAP